MFHFNELKLSSVQDTTRRNFAEVRIKMPKFNIETDIDASQVLMKLNVKQVFSGKVKICWKVCKKNLDINHIKIDHSKIVEY